MPKGRGEQTIRDVMHKFKHGQLRSGSKTGPIVDKRDQAIAIALSESGQSVPGQRRAKKSARR